MTTQKLTTKVVINTCYGGFCLSELAYVELGLRWDGMGFAYADDRSNPELVRCVEKLGEAANGLSASLKVIEITYGFEISDYDGKEKVSGVSWES